MTTSEEMLELNRLAELGILSAGLFHELMNCLTALSLGIERLPKHDRFSHVQKTLANTLSVSKKLEREMSTLRKYTQKKDERKIFSLKKEMKAALGLLKYEMRKKDLEIEVLCPQDIEIQGDPLRFFHLCTSMASYLIQTNNPNLRFEVVLAGSDQYRNPERTIVYQAMHSKQQIQK